MEGDALSDPTAEIVVRVGDEYDALAQQSSFTNATLQGLGPDDEWAVSIACFIRPGHEPGIPEHEYSVPELADIDDVRTYVLSALEDAVRLTGARLCFAVEIGPWEAPDA